MDSLNKDQGCNKLAKAHCAYKDSNIQNSSLLEMGFENFCSF